MLEVKMGSKMCMNVSCGAISTVEWKKGWPLRSGLLADLCYRCGYLSISLISYSKHQICSILYSKSRSFRDPVLIFLILCYLLLVLLIVVFCSGFLTT